ncbi:MAG TPA: hypothetical protein VFX58_16940, partial [Chitinophagaceae bacterium]|nr:hypothetical protein [Chitinophagaceae bacterium]
MKCLLIIATVLISLQGITQNLGIGTHSPQATLDVKGNLRVGGASRNISYDSVTGKISWNHSSLFVPT